MYKHGIDGTIIRMSDGAVIPNDSGNLDYKNWAAWVVAGGVTEPADVSQVIKVISRRQFFRALHEMGISESSVQAIIDAAPVSVQIDYRDFTEAYSNDESLLYVLSALGRPESDLNTLFDLGLTL